MIKEKMQTMIGYSQIIPILLRLLGFKIRTEKLKPRNQRYRKTKNRSTKRRKPKVLLKEGQKYRLKGTLMQI